MGGTRLIISSMADQASVIMGRYLLENYPFELSNDGQFYTYGSFTLVVTEKRHIYHESLEDDLRKIGITPEDVIFLSRHSSSAGIHSLTVHATGNLGDADLGGISHELSVSDPEFMTSSLLLLSQKGTSNFQVTFEATHHGPLLNIPNYFIEIGTTEKEWNDPSALSSVAEAVLHSEKRRFRNFVGVGGGHYSPKITSYAICEDVNVGHIISKHHHDAITEDMMLQAFRKTPDCSGFLMDKKGSRGRVREIVRSLCDKNGTELIQI